MSEKEKKILNTFQKILLEFSEHKKDKLLAFGEGMAFKSEQQKQEQARKAS